MLTSAALHLRVNEVQTKDLRHKLFNYYSAIKSDNEVNVNKMPEQKWNPVFQE